MQFKIRVLVFSTILLFCGIPLSGQQKRMLLWFDKPAWQPKEFSYNREVFTNPFHFEDKGWYEALPVGNGRLGGMVFGGALGERIQLNEESLWDGYARDAVNPGSGASLPEIQRLMFAGKIDEAEAMAEKNMMGIPVKIKPYQSLGDLLIDFAHNSNDTVYSDFKRWLSLDSALAVTQFKHRGKTYRREVFSSHPDQAMVVRISCDTPGSLDLNVRLLRQQDASSSNSGVDPKLIVMRGQVHCINEQTKLPVGMKFNSYVKAINKGGSVSVSPQGVMSVRGANELLLLIAGATNYAGKNPVQICEDVLRKTQKKSYAVLLKDHVNDHQSLFNRVSINLSSESNAMELPQDQRLERVRKNNFHDPYLSELLFQYGRYLLIASSRQGDLAANLQGLWNQTMSPPWSSDYHININLQMFYMGAEVANLADCHMPLFALTDSIANHGRRTAKMMYNANGWVVHHLTDVFWRTAPADGVVGVWPMGSGWLCHHPFEHYLFSGDKEFLRKEAFPLMKGAAEFYLDFLKPIPWGLPMAGRLVTNPSHSPENAFEKADGSQYQFTYGATMDLQICHELFTNCLKAIEDLSLGGKPYEPELKARLEKALANLASTQISKKTGGIQEWIEDYREPEIGHRHISHLYGLYPSGQINAQTPELFAAARKTLERRLAGNPNAAVEEAKNRYQSFGSYVNGISFGGWLSNWVSLMWIRLADSQEAYKHHQYQLQYGLKDNLFGGAYQLDATYGSTAVVAEMLIQSHTSTIDLLPALPKPWATGNVKGLRAQGGFQVDMQWEDNQLMTARITSKNGNTCRLRVKNPVRVYSQDREVKVSTYMGNAIEFQTKPGMNYSIVAR